MNCKPRNLQTHCQFTNQLGPEQRGEAPWAGAFHLKRWLGDRLGLRRENSAIGLPERRFYESTGGKAAPLEESRGTASEATPGGTPRPHRSQPLKSAVALWQARGEGPRPHIQSGICPCTVWLRNMGCSGDIAGGTLGIRAGGLPSATQPLSSRAG